MNFFELVKEDKTIRRALVISILVWIFLATMNVVGFNRYYISHSDVVINDVTDSITPQLESYSEKLDLFAVAFVGTDTEISIADYNEFSETLIGEDESIEYVLYSPHGEVANVYPYDTEYLANTIVNDFSIKEHRKFVDAVSNDSYFVTFELEGVNLSKLHYHKSIIIDDEFYGLVTLIVDTDKLIAQVPSVSNNDEVVLSLEEVYIKSSLVYDDGFKDYFIDIDGIEYVLSIDYLGSYYNRTIIMVLVATVILTAPLILVFTIFYVEQRRTKTLIHEVEYSRKYSIDTQLKNAQSFYLDIDELIKKSETFYLALGKFNNIKYINDKYGHKLGQEVVLEAVNLIKGVLRSNTELYHFGGDEYIFVLKTDAKGEANNILKRVLKIFDRDIVIDRIRTNISMTIGVVTYPSQGRTIDELIKNAHLTISNSHIMNSNAFAFYKKGVISNHLLNQDFDIFVKNLDLELFEVYLMPIIDCETNLIVGFECLTRAFNEFDEMLDTESVVNSLERNGRIQELDEIVFTKMLRMMRRINNEFPDNELFLSVNASALSFNEKYVDTVMEQYEQEHFAKGTIVLELTESYQVEDYDYLIRLFDKLNTVGIKTAIDDFGSGYSSLSYISKFPIYAIKVDKEYVRDYLTNDFNRTLFMTLRSIAKVLDCKLVAEGVDDPETLEFLRKNGCELYQGYLFSKGVTFEKSLKMIEKNLKEYSEE